MSSKECFVYIQLPYSHELTTVGRLTWETTGGKSVGTFVYGQIYQKAEGRIALDPFNLPIENREFETILNEGIFGPIRDASPDRWGRYVIEKNTPREEWDEVGYLLHSAEDRVGALSFGRGKTPHAPAKKFNQTVVLKDIIEAAHKLEQNQPISETEKTILLAGASMGGARPKTVVEKDNQLWLAKFPSYNDRHNFSKIEFATMKMAKDCGLNVPDIDITKIGGQDVFLIKRFDRQWDKSKRSYLRHHFVSGLTLLNLDERDTGRWSYLDLADQMRRWILKPTEDLQELFRRIVFNALISNQDDHPRNHGYIYLKKGYRLSDAYDLMPTPVVGTTRFSAMTIGTDRRAFTKSNLLSRADAFALSTKEAGEIFDQTKAKVSKWIRYYKEAKLSDDDIKYIEPAFNWDGLEPA